MADCFSQHPGAWVGLAGIGVRVPADADRVCIGLGALVQVPGAFVS